MRDVGGRIGCGGGSAMRAQEWRRAVAPLLPANDGWAHRAKLSYRVAPRWVLVGVLGESSGLARSTYVWTVTMPLFEPADHVNLSYSARVGGGACRVEDLDADSLRTAVLTAAASIPDEPVALRRLAALSLDTRNAQVFETVAYAQLLTGDVHTAALTLGAARRLPRKVNEEPWVAEVFDRMAGMEGLLLAGTDSDAIAQLDKWASATAAALRIERSV